MTGTSQPASGPATGAEPPQTRITDPNVMRALAHPARLTILEHLTSTGRAITATEAAEIVGLSPSATSYHLRALAKAGIIQDAPSRGDGRERVYQTPVERILTVSAERDADPDAKAAEAQLITAFLARADARLRAWRDNADHDSPEWFEAAVLNESMLLMTSDELKALTEQIFALMRPYRRFRREELDDIPEGARSVSIQLRAIPIP